LAFALAMDSSIIGTYVLALRLGRMESITVGRLGEIEFPAGWYLYAGSALGPGGLQARLARHQRRNATGKRLHWHIDYLRERASWGGAWICTSEKRLECTWAGLLRRLPGTEIVARGFGASDCHCPAHLVRAPDLPEHGWFASVLGAQRIIVGNTDLDELLRALVSGDDQSRELAALELGRFGADACGPLAVMLVGGNADARWWAARTLAQVGGQGAVPPLVSALADDDADVRACAALALGRLGAESSAPALARLLADESAFVASIAADALSMVGEPAAQALAKMLVAEQPHARLLAVRALGRIKAESSIGSLFAMLEDPSYLVRYYAQEALDALGVGTVFLAP
jgi:Uri superfamily endonuclease